MEGLDYLYIALLMIGSYLFANINFAKIISKFKRRDITKEGSGNPGTLNMLRTFGFFWAITNMVLEILKGVLPSLVGYLLYGDLGLYLCGLSAILGHIYPVVFKFKGGKGVACCCGMFFVANWWITLIVVAVCFTFVTITSMGSIGTLGFVLISAFVQLFMIDPQDWICYILLGLIVAIIFYAHRKNLVRLFKGQENPTNIRGAFKKDVEKIKARKQNTSAETQTEVNNSIEKEEIENKVEFVEIKENANQESDKTKNEKTNTFEVEVSKDESQQ